MKKSSLGSVAPTDTSSPRMVRLSQPVGLCQLFRPVVKDSSKRPTLNETYVYGDDLTLRFSAREALAAPEQTLLLVLLEFAQEQYKRRPLEHQLDRSDKTQIGSQLWTLLHEASPGPGRDAPATLRLSFSWRELHLKCGAKTVGGTLTESRRASLERLCEVTVWERSASTSTVRSGRLVSWLVGDDQRVHVALNHRLALALVSSGYSQVLLCERFKLSSHTSMLVHAFLSTCLRAGKSMSIGYETLVERLWPGSTVNACLSTHRRRLADVQAALRSVGRLEKWQVELGTSVAVVKRKHALSHVELSTGQHKDDALRAVTATEDGAHREMTKGGHFKAQDVSYTERPFWKKSSSDKHLPQYDKPGTNF